MFVLTNPPMKVFKFSSGQVPLWFWKEIINKDKNPVLRDISKVKVMRKATPLNLLLLCFLGETRWSQPLKDVQILGAHQAMTVIATKVSEVNMLSSDQNL